MNTIRYPIFRKDFAILLKLTVAALIVQAAIMVGYPPIALMMDCRLGNLDDWFPQVQMAIGVLVALVAAGYWFAEERMGGNLCFLQRLPVSSRRIFTEKTMAGIGILLVLWLCQVAWCMQFYSTSKSFMSSSGLVFTFSLLVVSLYAYGLGLPLSRYLKQTISVVLIGILAVVVLSVFLLILWEIFHEALKAIFLGKYEELNVVLYILFATPLILIVYGSAIFRQTLFWKPRSHFDYLSQIYFSQNRLCQWLIHGVLILACFRIILINESNLISLVILVSSICAVVSIAIGASTYTNEEKHGLKNVLFYQPIHLGELYWVRWLCGLCLALIPVLCFTLYLLFQPNNPFTHHLKIRPFTILFSTLLFGLIPFACGAFVTHAIRNTLYAFFESIAAYAISLSLVFYSINNLSIWFSEYSGEMFWNDMSFDFVGFFKVSLFLFAGFALAGWRTVTDRELLTRGTWYRQLYVGRLFLFVLVVTFVFVKTGWKDLFFLVTGIDIG